MDRGGSQAGVGQASPQSPQAGTPAPPILFVEEDQYEREDIQKKTFAKWINSQLAKGHHPPVTDLFFDLRDGTRLLALLEVLTGRTYRREKGRMRVHHLNNVSRALAVLEEHGVRLINISNEHIVDGSAKLTLGLVWAIILHWQVQGVLKDVLSDLQQTNLEKTLLAWCRQTTKGYYGVDIRNFTTCWSDGLAFNALLHAHRPQLFEWTVVARKHSYARLENAFRVANEHLGIERLLDPEDVNSQTPDKKSVMMYVMCLFQALPHDSFTVENLDTSLGSDTSSASASATGLEASALASPMGKGRPLSAVSIGLGGYQRTLEEVLSWLLGAEDRLAAMPPIADTTDSVKDQFHDLEELMLDLTAKQGGIGDVLGEGSRLLREGVMEEEEEEEVRVQMKLLNTRWEELRVRAMDRQSRLHERLMALQQRQLEGLKKWLTETEDRIANMSQVGPTTAALEQQVTAHQQLQQDLEAEQSNINSLSNMVVVVDEASADSVYSTLEDELNALGERWAHICRWTESRWSTLQTLNAYWPRFEADMGRLREWVDSKAKMLRQFESEPVTDEGQVLRHASALQVLEAEMEAQQQGFDILQDMSSKILIHIPEDSPPHTTLPSQLEDVQDSLDLLTSMMEAQTTRLAASGIDIKKVAVPVEMGAGGGAEVVRSATTTITSRDSTTTLVTKVVTTKVTETISGSSVKRQKMDGGTQEDFSVALTKLGEWMGGVEEKAQSEGVQQLSLQQLSLLLHQLEAEMAGQQAEYDQVVSLGQSALSETSTTGESDGGVAEAVEGVVQRWNALTHMLEEIRCRMAFITCQDEVTAALTHLEEKMGEVERWREAQVEEERRRRERGEETTGAAAAGAAWEGKLEEVENYEEEAEKLRRRVEGVEERWPEERQALVKKVEENLEGWRKLRGRLREATPVPTPTTTITVTTAEQETAMEVTTTTTTESAPPQPPSQQPPQALLKAIGASREWLEGLASTLGSGGAPISQGLTALEERLGRLKELQQKVESERTNMDHITSTCASLMKEREVTGTLEGCEGLEEDVGRLSEQWEATTRTLKERTEAIEKAVGKVRQFEEEVSGLQSWLGEVEVFLGAEEAALGDVETLEAQLEQSNALQDDISTLRTNMDNITTAGAQLLQEARAEDVDAAAGGSGGGVEYANTLQRRLDALTHRWQTVTHMATLQNKSLREALARSQKVHKDLQDFNTWLNGVEARIPTAPTTTSTSTTDITTTTTIDTPEKLTAAAATLQTLREEITAKMTDLSALNKIGDEMLQADSAATHEELARSFTQVNRRWTALTAKVDDGHKRVSEATQRYVEFKRLCGEEEAWLEQLEEKLRGSSRDAVDAEEISEALDALDLFLHTHDEGRLEAIRTLGEGLVGAGFVGGHVTQTTAALTQRFATLNAQARERQTGLEGRIQEAQAWEREYVGVLDHLSQADASLSQALTDGVMLLDLTVLESELVEQVQVLERMRAQVEVYRGEGKGEAAGRLEDQVTHLQRKYEEVDMKLRLCQKPPDFDQRLQATEEQLLGVRGSVTALSLASPDPDAIEEQLTQCMALYQKLSEVKGEVEEVIAKGRRIVKEGQCSNPEDLTAHLDRVKAIYNQLGGAVTEQRGALERAVRHARKLAKECGQLEEWLGGTEAELDQREAAVPTQNLQAEAHFVQHALEDLSRRKPQLVGLQEGLASLVQQQQQPTTPTTTSTIGTSPLEERVADLAHTWERVTTRLNNRLVNVQTEQAGKESEMESFIVGLGEVKGWLESTEAQLATLSTLSDEEQERLVKAVSEEAQRYKGQISNIRSTSEDLVRHGVLFQARVSPELDEINERWERIYTTLQLHIQASPASSLKSSRHISPSTAPTSAPTTKTEEKEGASDSAPNPTPPTTSTPTWMEEVVRPLVSHNLVEEKVEANMFSSTESGNWVSSLAGSVVMVAEKKEEKGVEEGEEEGDKDTKPKSEPLLTSTPTSTQSQVEVGGGEKTVNLVEVEEVKMTISHLSFNIPSSASPSSSSPSPAPAPRPNSEADGDLDALIAGLQEVAKGTRGRGGTGLITRNRADDDDLESLTSLDTDMAPASEASRDMEATFSDLESISESVSSSRGVSFQFGSFSGTTADDIMTTEQISQNAALSSYITRMSPPPQPQTHATTASPATVAPREDVQGGDKDVTDDVMTTEPISQTITVSSYMTHTSSTMQTTIPTTTHPSSSVAPREGTRGAGKGMIGGELPVEELQAMIAELEEVMSDESESEDEARDGHASPPPPSSPPLSSSSPPPPTSLPPPPASPPLPPSPPPPTSLPPPPVSPPVPHSSPPPPASPPPPPPPPPYIHSDTHTPSSPPQTLPQPPHISSTPTQTPATPETPKTPIEFSIQEVHVGGVEFAKGKDVGEHSDAPPPPRLPHIVVTTTTTTVEDDACTVNGASTNSTAPPQPDPDAPKRVSIHSSEVVHGITVISSSGTRLPEAQEAVRVTLISQPGSVEGLAGDAGGGGECLEEEEEEEEEVDVSSLDEEPQGSEDEEQDSKKEEEVQVAPPPVPTPSHVREGGKTGGGVKRLERQEALEEEMSVERTFVREKQASSTTSTTITTTITSTSALPEEKDEIEDFLREVSKMSDKVTALTNQTHSPPPYQVAQARAEALEQEVGSLEPDVATVISRGDTLTLKTHAVDVQRAHNIRLAVNDLRAQWSTLKTHTEAMKQEVARVCVEVDAVSGQADSIIAWCNDVSKRLHLLNNDEGQLKALETEMARRREELDALNESGALLRKYQYTQIQPVLTLLNMRWTEIAMQFRQYRKGSLEKKAFVETTTTTTTTSTSPPQLLATISKLREDVAATSQQLTGPTLATPMPYTHLKAQEEELKSIKESLAALKPRVDAVEEEREALGRGGAGGDEEAVRRAGDKLREEWAQVNRGHTDRHNRWLHCSQTLSSLHHTLDDFTAWLTTAEEKVATSATQPLPQMRLTQKELEKQVTLKHRPSQSLQTMCKEVVEGQEAEEGRRLQERVEGVMKRWRGLLVDLAARRERITGEDGGKEVRKEAKEETSSSSSSTTTIIKETITTTTTAVSSASAAVGGSDVDGLGSWVEQVEALMAAPVNVTDEASLSAHSTMVQNHVQELPTKQAQLRRLKESRGAGTTEAQLTTLEAGMDKVARTLPDYQRKVETKLGVIQTLGKEVEELYRWTEEVRVKVALRNLSEEEVRTLRGQVQEREAQFEGLDSTYWVMAQDVEAKGLTVAVALKNRISTIETRLKMLQAQVSEAEEGARGGAGGAAAPPVGSTVTPNVTSVIKDVMKLEECVLREGQDMRPPSPLVCPPRHPPDSSPVLILASLDKSILQIRDWLTLMEQMSRQQTVVVGDADDIRRLTEKQKNVLRELEGKKPQLDELVSSADGLKEDASRTQLHQKVSKLREHWDETNSVVLARKTQLDAMYSDTHKFDAKRAELEAWLGRMEGRLERMAPVARTADVLDQQIREQKGFHAEIHQYKHQLELFNQMTQRLIAIYQHDDTRRLKKITETINFRYSSLNASIIARGKELHSAINSLHNFDKALDKFASWMSEMESGSEMLEGEVDKLGPPPPTSTGSSTAASTRGHLPLHHPQRAGPTLHLKDLQSEIESHKDVLASLNATGQKLLGTLENQEEAVMLQRRLEEMNHRWNTLKHKSIAIRNRLEGNSENWTTLLLSLRELIEWVIRKDTELTALGPLVGDPAALTKYAEDLASFRRVIEEKQPVIESNLKSGRQLIASEPPLSDTSDSEAGRELDGDARYRGDETARDLTRAVRREVAKLSEKWAALRERVSATTTHTDLAHKKLGVLSRTVEEVSARLEEAERVVEGWGGVPQDPNLADQHAHNVKKFREGLMELQRGVDDVNDQAARFSAHSVPLTPANSARLHELNTRWKNLESTVNDRWRQVAGRSREVTPLTPAQLASSVAPPWERATTTNKVPYYINHEQESTHWDHPAMMDVLDSLTEFNHIKFSAYRTATKLRVLQKKLALDKAKMQTATDIFDEHGLRGQNDRLIDVGDMVVVLSALYGTIAADHPGVDTTLAMDLCLNWLLNVYDSQRTGQMRVLSFKIGLVCLCTGHLEEKYRYMFRLIADPNRLVDQRKLGLLLHDCVQVPRQLGEVAAFGGSNIEPSVRSCFTKAGKDRETIEAVHFLAWVQQEPQSLVWLAVLHRVAASESIQHQVKCNICKAYPIVGLRYRCLKCLSFDMCQECFFDGRSGKSHKITHPMHEYCTATTAGEDVKDFTKALKNKFKSKRSLQKHTKKGYLPVQTVLEGDPLESPSPSPQHNVTSQDMHSRLEMYASRLAEVELRTNSNSTPDSEDEHGLIAQYCQSLSSSDAPLPVPRSPLQIMAAVDADQKDELEQMIRALEEENSVLQAEYDRLKSQQPVGSPPEDGLGGPQRSEAEMLAEAKLLRQHKGRLEARMGILEEHNRQLEAQLHRLRQLLGESGLGSPSKSGTLQTKSVTASQLAMDSPAKVNGHSAQGELGKAVGTLVATMNQEQGSDLPSEEDEEEAQEEETEEEERPRPIPRPRHKE